MTVLPALPITLGEQAFLAGEGSLGAGIAGLGIRFVYCQCGEVPKAEDWHEHLRAYAGARYLDDNGPHEAVAFERPADYRNDCMVWVSEPPETENR